MKTNIYPHHIHNNKSHPHHAISLASLIQQYCLNPNPNITLIVQGSSLYIYQHQNNICKQNINSYHTTNSNLSKKQQSNLFANAISKIQANSKLGEYHKGNTNDKNQYNNIKSKFSNNDRNYNMDKASKQSNGSKSPLKRRNNHNPNFRETSPNQYVSKTNYNCYQTDNHARQEQQQKNQPAANNAVKIEQQKYNEKKTHKHGNAYKIINKTYKNTNNIIQPPQNQLPIASINKNSMQSKDLDCGSLVENNKNLQSQIVRQFDNHIDLSFQNLNNFGEIYSAQPRIGQVLPPTQSIQPFNLKVEKEQIIEYKKIQHYHIQKNTQHKKQEKSINVQLRQSSKVNILVSDSSSQQKFISSQYIKRIQKKTIQNLQLPQNNNHIKKSIIEQLEGLNSSRKYKMSRIQQKQQQNNPQSDKKAQIQPQGRFQQIINPYAFSDIETQRHESHQMMKKSQKQSKKYTDEQVCQIIQSKKKAIIQKNSQIGGGINKNLLTPLEKQILQISDFDISALIKIEESEKIQKNYHAKSDVSLAAANIAKSGQAMLSQKNINLENPQNEQIFTIARYTLHVPNKQVTQNKGMNSIQTPLSIKIQNSSSQNLCNSFIPHYLLQHSSRNNQQNVNESQSHQLFVPSNIYTTKPTSSHVYQAQHN